MENLSTPNSNKKSFNYLYLTVGLLMISISLVLGYALYIKKNDSASIFRIFRKQETNLQKAEKIFEWMNGNRDENGIFYQKVICNNAEKTCKKIVRTGTSGHTSLGAIWSEFLLLKAGSKKITKEMFLADLDKYWKIGLYENEFWNCKMMKQIADSDLLTDKEKQIAKNICIDGSYYPTSAIELQLKDNIYSFVATESANKVDSKIYSGKMYYMALYPSDLIAKYQITNNKNDLELAKHYFEVDQNIFKTNFSFFSPSDLCSFGISSLDFYSITNDSRYLDYAKTLIGNNFSKTEIDPFFASPRCGIFAKQLSEATKDPVYTKIMSKMIEIYDSNQRDSTDLKSSLAGDGAYFDIDKIISEKSVKSTNENALMIYLLLNDIKK